MAGSVLVMDPIYIKGEVPLEPAPLIIPDAPETSPLPWVLGLVGAALALWWATK